MSLSSTKIKSQFLFWAKSAKYALTTGRKSNESSYPTVVNLLANDICNSKCTMCNIWQQKKDYELTPAEFGTILSDDFYKKIKHIGITGGEPTLREDLPQLVEEICKAAPKLKALSIITNAIKTTQVLQRITESIKIANRHGKNFSVMVSLDGYKEYHDKHRGVKGNWSSAMEVIRTLKTRHPNLSVSIGCTITKLNVWKVDELLDYLIAEGLYGRFRIGEFITRLYNDDNTETIRNFDTDERYHLSCFFTRLIREYETDPKYQLTYKNIISMLNGGKRMIGCPYHKDATVLDSRGDILYCAPKSEKIGNGLSSSALSIYRDNLYHLQQIKDKDCNDCIHDYHFYTDIALTRKDLTRKYYNLIFSIKGQNILFTSKINKNRKKNKNQVTITGWFGTETVGDKAILGGIVTEIKASNPKAQIIVSSIYPFVTHRTLQETNIDASVVDIYSREFIDTIETSSEVIMGGGPLMDLDVLGIPLTAFKIAKKSGVKTTIMGCGLGPLFKTKYIKSVKQILNLTDDIRLRDNKSVELASSWFPNKNIVMSGDYAHSFVLQRSQYISHNSEKPYIACCLREWSKEYKDSLSDNQFHETKQQFEAKLFNDLKKLSIQKNLPLKFICMHTFSVGGDDRVFYRRMAIEHFKDFKNYEIDEFPSSVDGIIQALKGASISICMRFHSVLFAQSLSLDYVALDYTNGGKIYNLLTDLNMQNKYLKLIDYTSDEAVSLVDKVDNIS